MIRKLYGESKSRVKKQGEVVDSETAKASFAQQLKERQEFTSNYVSYIFYSTFGGICCCSSMQFFKKKLDRYKKFQLALERLLQEQDIQYMIEMNRVTRVLHKATFLVRQRRAVDYSHRYVISDKDLTKADLASPDLINEKLLDPKFVDKLIEDFDPENSVEDRRILYEVTGQELFADEFFDEDSSDSDKDEKGEEKEEDGGAADESSQRNIL